MTQKKGESNMHFTGEGGGASLKKCIFISILIFSFSLFVCSEEDDLLKIEASVSPKRLSRGKEGKIVLKLVLEEGITIIPQPSFIIELNPCKELDFPKNLFTASHLEIKILEENGEEYLDLKDPIEMPFSVRMDAKQGNHLVEGKIKYFACSREEGWCLRDTSKFRAVFSVRRTKLKTK